MVLEEELELSLKSVKLLKICTFIRKLVTVEQTKSVPARELLEAGLLQSLINVLNNMAYSSTEIISEVTWILINLSSH
jgi:hypothetical protein